MTEALQIQGDRLTAVEIRAQVNLIQEVMKAVMKVDVHYGKIPGTPKPTLYKAGAEKILMTFRIAAQVANIEDLSTPDAIRYRVTMRAISQTSGAMLGEGSGECSSDEEKYRWRRPVHENEYLAAPADRKREKYQRDGSVWQQVRTEPADVANTILKMAVKRALIAMTLVVTAASDVFAQDIEDLPEEIRESVAGESSTFPPKEPPQPPRRAEPAPQHPPAQNGGTAVRKISEAQARRMFAIGKGAGWSQEDYRNFLKNQYGLERDTDMAARDYEKACKELQDGAGA